MSFDVSNPNPHQPNHIQTSPRIQSIIKNFTRLLQLIQTSQWKKGITKASKTYNIKLYNLDKVTLNRVRQMYFIIVEKFYVDQKNKQNWHQNQLRIYVWLLFSYANYLKKSPQDFQQNNWQILSNAFSGKSVSLCQFQYQSLKKLSQKTNKWTQQEDELLKYILKQKEIKNKWNQVAKQFYIQSEKNWFRTPKQCRQRWNNYLDPKKTKQGWSQQQDYQLIQLVKQKGKKWALISKILVQGRRTQHMVKNRFNSLVVKFLKSENKTLHPDAVQLDDLQQWIGSKNDERSNQSEKGNKKQKKNGIQKKEYKQSNKNGQSVIQQELQDAVKIEQIEQGTEQRQNHQNNFINCMTPNIISNLSKQFQKIQKSNNQKKQDLLASQRYAFQVKSPAILISPLPISNFTPSLIFSPYTDFANTFNLFSYQHLDKSRHN